MERITKKEARKRYNNGLGVTFAPSKCCPKSMLSVLIFKKEDDNGFDNLVNHFSYYNCTKVTGLRVTFYATN